MGVRSSEGLGAAFIAAPVPLRRKVPPSGDHQQPEDCVCEREDPERSLVEEDALDPVLDEALAVGGRTGPHAKPGFQCCERAELAKPGLRHDYSDGCDMRKPEPQTVHPPPTGHVSCDDKHQAADDEQHDAEVKQKHYVGKELVRHGGGCCGA